MANGSFKSGQIVFNNLGMTEQEIKEKCPKNAEYIAWVTILILRLLEKKFAKEKNLWYLIADKGKKYLRQRFDNFSLVEISRKANSELTLMTPSTIKDEFSSDEEAL